MSSQNLVSLNCSEINSASRRETRFGQKGKFKNLSRERKPFKSQRAVQWILLHGVSILFLAVNLRGRFSTSPLSFAIV